MLEMQQKEVVSAAVRAYCQERKNLVVEVELPGVEREDITLKMNSDCFHVVAEGPDFIYEACEFFLDETTLDGVWAEFDRDLLTITVPFSRLDELKEIAVH